MKRITCALASLLLQLALLPPVSAQTESDRAWKQEGMNWAGVAVCMDKRFAEEFRRVAIQTLKNQHPGSAANGMRLASAEFDQVYPKARSKLTRAQCEGFAEDMRELLATRKEGLRLRKQLEAVQGSRQPAPAMNCRTVVEYEQRPFNENVCDYNAYGPVNCRNVTTRYDQIPHERQVCN